MFNQQKGFIKIIIITVIAFIIATAGYFVLTQKNVEAPAIIQESDTADKTAQLTDEKSAIKDWKTYKNEKYGFEIKYPENWSFVQSDKGVKLTEKNEKYEIRIYSSQDKDISRDEISALDNKVNYINFEIDGVSVWKYKEIQYDDMSWELYNLIGKLEPFDEVSGNDSLFRSGFFLNGKKFYEIRYYFPKDLKLEQLKQKLTGQMDEIVKTFKFNKQ